MTISFVAAAAVQTSTQIRIRFLWIFFMFNSLCLSDVSAQMFRLCATVEL